MAVYVTVFFVSTIFFKLGESVRKKQGIYLGIYLDYIAIFSLCLLAGFRAETIGTDTAGYIQPMIKGAISSENVKDFLKYSWMDGYSVKRISDYETGYSLVVYLSSTIFNWLLCQFIMLCVKKKMSLFGSVCLFLCYNFLTDQ